MDIREKTLAGLIGIFVMVTIVLLFLSQTILLDSYRKIESAGVTDDVNVILSNIHDEFGNLETSVSDWGPWDDVYNFTLGNNPAFVQDNLAKNTYHNLRLNFIVVTNTSGMICYGQSYNLTDGTFSQLPDDLAMKITTDPSLLHRSNANPTSGFLVLPDSTALIAAYPVLHSDLSGPPAGTLIMGRYLNDAEIQSIGLPSKSPPSFSSVIPPSSISGSAGSHAPAIQISPVSEEIIQGNATLTDIDGNDAIILSQQVYRDIYLQGKQTILFFLLLQIIVLLILGTYIIYRIDRSILVRVNRIISDIRAVSDGTILRIGKTGNDEIAQLAEAMNQMIGQLEQSHADLKDSEEKFRSFVQGSSDGYILLNSRGHVIEWNAANERITGIARHEVLGKPYIETLIRLLIPELKTQETINRMRQEDASIIATGKFSGFYQPQEIRIIRPDSTRRTLQHIAFPIEISGEKLFGIISRDITQSRMTEEALQQSRRRLNSLNIITFQDIRNAVFSLLGYHALAENVTTVEEGREILKKENFFLKQIDKSLNSAKNYQDLGINPPRWQDVNQVFLFALSHFDTLRITRTVQLNNLELFADPLLERAFINLLENTFAQGVEVTMISLSYQKTKTGLDLILEDNGRGIAADEKEKVFEYGYDRGIDLFLVREILSISGMIIRESGIEAQGNRFVIAVPEGMYRFSSDRK
jgi:PAS domain S-box-containing protein